MTALQIIQPDNPLLRRQALRVTDFGAEFQALVDNMIDTMMEARGLGLAGPQVSQSLRVVLARLPDGDESQEQYGDDAGKLYVIVNPTVTRRSDEKISGVEGCLSLPGLLGDVERHEVNEISAQDRRGRPARYTARGWLARVFQHEIDHLDGILYVDIATKVWRPEDEEVGLKEMNVGP